MVGVIIQARMGSTRMPGKTMSEICNKPLLYYSAIRSTMAKYVDSVVVATSDAGNNAPITKWCENNNIRVFKGSESDVLDRFYHAAKKYNLKYIVRVTADNPFIDPRLIDLMVLTIKNYNYDYITMRNKTNTWPYGLDVEVFNFETLEKTWKEAERPDHREHVTMYMKERPNEFEILELPYKEDIANIRLTVDYPEDFEFASKMLEDLIKKEGIEFTWKDVVELYKGKYE